MLVTVAHGLMVVTEDGRVDGCESDGRVWSQARQARQMQKKGLPATTSWEWLMVVTEPVGLMAVNERDGVGRSRGRTVRSWWLDHFSGG